MLQSDKATAVGHVPSGLFIVAVRDPATGQCDGYLGSWIQQVSFEPLMISLAIKPGRPAYDLIKSGKTFGVNIVGDHDKSFMKLFWKGYDPKENPFDQIPHEFGKEGGLIMKGAKSTLECRLSSFVKPGDHEIIFAEVLASYVQSDEAKPLTHVRKSGAQY